MRYIDNFHREDICYLARQDNKDAYSFIAFAIIHGELYAIQRDVDKDDNWQYTDFVKSVNNTIDLFKTFDPETAKQILEGKISAPLGYQPANRTNYIMVSINQYRKVVRDVEDAKVKSTAV